MNTISMDLILKLEMKCHGGCAEVVILLHYQSVFLKIIHESGYILNWTYLVLCMAWPQAKSQAKLSLRSQGQAKPNGLAWRWFWISEAKAKP